MKFQDSSFNGLKVTVGTKSVTHPRTHPRTHARSKSNMPHQLFQSWGHNNNNQSRINGPINAHLTIAQVMPRYNHNNEKTRSIAVKVSSKYLQ